MVGMIRDCNINVGISFSVRVLCLYGCLCIMMDVRCAAAAFFLSTFPFPLFLLTLTWFHYVFFCDYALRYLDFERGRD